jgi:(R,R)-butanediol dehydrogenase/meso-butanediol dehydrogenase/diacetyl reductase
LALAQAVPGTRVVVVGLQDGTHPVEFRNLALRENELIGTNAHAFAGDFEQGTRLLAARVGGWSDVAPVAIPLDDLVDLGLQPMVEGSSSSIKTLIDPWAKEVRNTI